MAIEINPSNLMAFFQEDSGISKATDRLFGMASLLSPGSKMHKAAMIGSAATSIYSIGKEIYGMWKESKDSSDYYIQIQDSDPLYGIVQKWILDTLSEEEITHSKYTSYYSSDPKTGKGKVNLSKQISGEFIRDMVVDGHDIIVSLDSPNKEPEKDGSSEAPAQKSGFGLGTINFYCETFEGRGAVENLLQDLVSEMGKEDPKIYRHSMYGFYSDKSAASRPLESVILKEGQMGRIVSRLEQFVSNEEAYIKSGIPYHTGFLLHGPPGTGKSSCLMSVAGHLGMDTYFLNLSTIADDDDLFSCAMDIKKHSLVVIEDIDVFSSARERDVDSGDKGLTMSGLLNVLDGQMSPHGAIFAVTTNRIDELEDAVIRDGRIDFREELTYMDNHQLVESSKYFMGSVPPDLPEISVEDQIAPAELVGIMKRYLPEMSAAGTEVVEYVKGRVKSRAGVL